jgi:hypothetical protein
MSVEISRGGRRLRPGQQRFQIPSLVGYMILLTAADVDTMLRLGGRQLRKIMAVQSDRLAGPLGLSSGGIGCEGHLGIPTCFFVR